MATESGTPTQIGAVSPASGEVIVKYTGKRQEVYDLLAVLTAQLLLDTTESPAQFKEVFNNLQYNTSMQYNALLLNKIQTKPAPSNEADPFDFLQG